MASAATQRIDIIATYEKHNSYTATAKEIGCDRKTVKKWVDAWKANKDASSLKDKPRSGRPRVLSDTAAATALELLLDDDFDGAEHVARELATRGLVENGVSKWTVNRAAKATAAAEGDPIKAKRGRPSKMLTVATKQKRVRFAKANQRRSWKNVMFTDRKRFSWKYPGCKVKLSHWRRESDIAVEALVNSHPPSVNVYCGLTRHGMTKPHIVAGTSKHTTSYTTKAGTTAKNITAAEYKDVLEHTLLPGGQAIFSKHGITFWVFQQDNDPTHKDASLIVQQWGSRQASNPVLLAPWPPHSPDLNPIENVWAWVQAKVDRMGCKTFEDFQQAVIETLAKVPKKMCSNLVDSMQRRLALVIEREGGKTGY